MTPKVIWNGLPIDTETLVSKHKSCVNDLGKLCEDNAKLAAENARLLKRVDDLEVAVANGMNDATRFVDRNGWLESEHERLRQANKALSEALLAAQAECQAHQEYAYPKIQRLAEDRTRLRGLLKTYKHQLDKRWREGTRVDSYARGYQDGLEAAEVIFDDVFKAELAKGE